MAVGLAAAGGGLSSTLGPPSPTLFSICGHVLVRSRTNGNDETVFLLTDNVGGTTGYIGMVSTLSAASGGANDFRIITSSNGGGAGSGNSAFATQPPIGQWLKFALTCQGTGATDCKAYWAREGDSYWVETLSLVGKTFTSVTLYLGTDQFDDWGNLGFDNVMVFDGVLSADELWSNVTSRVPIAAVEKLNRHTPLQDRSNLYDFSPNSRGWTLIGAASGNVDEPSSGYGWAAPREFADAAKGAAAGGTAYTGDVAETVTASESVAAKMATSAGPSETVSLAESLAASRGIIQPLSEVVDNQYATAFATDEDPISESGKWSTNAGGSWTRVTIVSGRAQGNQTGTNGFDDSYAHLTDAYGPDQEVSCVIHKGGSTAGILEVEILLRVTDAENGGPANDVKLYECNLARDGSYANIYRWRGAIGTVVGDFTLLGSGSVGAVNDGDVFKARIVGNTITTFLNGVQIATADITSQGGATYTSGKPGIGFYRESGSSASSTYCFESMTARTIPSLDESAAAVYGGTANINETASLAESLATQAAMSVPLNETVTASESAAASQGMSVGPSETVSAAESVAVSAGSPIAANETVTVNESLTAQMTTSAGPAETVPVSEAVAASQGMLVGLNETATASESVAASAGSPIALAETVTLSESLAALYGAVANLAETVLLSEQLTALQAMQAALAETVSIVEALAAIYGAVVGLSETLTASESIQADGGAGGVDIGETVSVSENLSAVMATSAQVAETVSLAEAIAASRGEFVALAESLGALTEALAAIYGANASLAETVPVSESVAATGGSASVTLAETVTLSELIQAIVAATAPLNESISVAEAVVAAMSANPALAETVAFNEALAASAAAAIALNESLGSVTESLAAVLGHDGSVAELVTLAENLTTRYDGHLPLAEVIALVESISVVFISANEIVARLPSRGTRLRFLSNGKTRL